MSTVAPIRPTLTAARLASAPLPVLLAATGAEVVDSSIIDPGFFGAVVERRDGQIVLSLPTGRPAVERDTITRHLLAEVLGVRLSGLPVPARRELAGVSA